MKRIYILCCFVFMFLFMGAASVSANSSPGIKIDGQARVYDPPCQIEEGRAMIPIRYVVEDPALQGTVGWDAGTEEVSILCKGKNFIFKIFSPTVKVDSQEITLDAAPYIYQNRTYIPLRFLSEQLGAQVSWNELMSEVSINFNQMNQSRSQVFAYYYYRSFSEFEEHANLITDVALRWFETNADGDLYYEYQDDYDKILQFAREKGIKTHASVVFMDKDGLHSLLSDSDKRQYLITQLCKQVKQNNYDGVNIDFEYLGEADRDNFSQFLRELKLSLGDDKQLSVALFACTKPESWLTGYDYESIGKIADRVIIMAYDYSYKGSSPGPVAPLWWDREVVSYLKTIIPPGKMLLGLPTYGYNWGDGLSTATVTETQLKKLMNQYNLTESFDEASMSPCYRYTDNNGVNHQIWLENSRSLNAKLDVAQDNKLAGVSFWRIGNGFSDLYDVLAARAAQN